MSRTATARLLCVLAAGLFLQCREAPRSHNWFAMDTNMAVTLYGGKGRISDAEAFARVDQETSRLETLFTDYASASPLSKVRGKVGDTLTVDPEIHTVLSKAMEMHQASRGAFDITLHDLKTLWGLDAGQAGNVPAQADLEALLRDNPTFGASIDATPQPPVLLLSGNRVVIRRNEIQLDVGGIAKGYIVDRLHALLDSLGFPNHIVQAGGDIRVGGRKSSGDWNVGIRHPRRDDSLAGNLRSAGPFAVSTAGDYERFFIRDGVRYHHIFDPRTGRPVQGVVAVTVTAKTSLAADAIDDALFVLGPRRGTALARAFGVQAVWFVAAPSVAGGVCAVPLPEMRALVLAGVPRCPDM